jgi:hypothetical protein
MSIFEWRQEYKPTDAPDGTPSTGATDRNNTFCLATDDENLRWLQEQKRSIITEMP